MHVLLHHFVYPYTDEDTLAPMLATVAEHGRTWRADGVKFRLDGVIDTGTAWLEEPDSVGEGASQCGPTWSSSALGTPGLRGQVSHRHARNR